MGTCCSKLIGKSHQDTQQSAVATVTSASSNPRSSEQDYVTGGHSRVPTRPEPLENDRANTTRHHRQSLLLQLRSFRLANVFKVRVHGSTRSDNPRTRSISSGYSISHYSKKNSKIVSLQNYADRLVIETLDSIRPPVLSEPSSAMHKLQIISGNETGWIIVINSLINNVDDDNPFGTALILLSIEEACLASRETILRLHELIYSDFNNRFHNMADNIMPTSSKRAYKQSMLKQRNISIVLGCLAEKLAGTLSSVLFTEELCDYLLSCIHPANNPIVILYSLIALEKFAITQDNRTIIDKKLNALTKTNSNSLLVLENWTTNDEADNLHYKPRYNYYEQQVGFCAKHCLDNFFMIEGRPYSFELIDKSNLYAFLNSKDASENLKISADSLSCRNDTSKFESVRGNIPVSSSVYYYEAKLMTVGVMQIGFATKSSKFLNHEGYGVGDDDQSIAYDGCRSLIWYDTKSLRTNLPRWQPGDIIGCLINLNDYVSYVQFSLNGQPTEPIDSFFANKNPGTNYYVALSLMPFQQVSVNFGSEPFKYPPINCSFRTFNEEGRVLGEKHVYIPKHLILKESIDSYEQFADSCTICCDGKMEIILLPCEHDGFCKLCADKLTTCPMCRSDIDAWALSGLQQSIIT